MELMLTIITIAAILALTIIVRFYRDALATVSTRRRNQALIAISKKRANKPFTIIITLGRKAETLFPLLDSLRQQHDATLQIIVIAKTTAGKNAGKNLATYSKQHNLTIKTVPHDKSKTTASVAQQYATGSFIMEMQPYELLVPNSIAHMCIEFLVAPKTDALRVRYYYRPDRTLLSGLVALAQLTSGQSSHRLVYRRGSMHRAQPATVDSALAGIILPSSQGPSTYRSALSAYAQSMHVLRAILYILATLAIVVALALIDDPTSRLTIVTIALVCLLTTSTLQVIEQRRYTVRQIVDLVLVAPLYLAFALAVAITKIVTLRRR